MRIAGDDIALVVKGRPGGSPLGIVERRRGGQVAHDLGVMELMSFPRLPLILELAIPQAQPHSLHARREGQYAAHRITRSSFVNDLSAEVHHPAAFRQHFPALSGETGDGLTRGLVARERGQKELRVAPDVSIGRYFPDT